MRHIINRQLDARVGRGGEGRGGCITRRGEGRGGNKLNTSYQELAIFIQNKNRMKFETDYQYAIGRLGAHNCRRGEGRGGEQI